MAAVRCNDLTGVRRLLDEAPEAVTEKDESGATALHWAAHGGQMDVADLLIAGGADVNARDKYGRTPLHWVASFSGNAALAEMLIERGADIDAVDRFDDGTTFGRSSLARALEKGDRGVIDVLERHGARGVYDARPPEYLTVEREAERPLPGEEEDLARQLCGLLRSYAEEGDTADQQIRQIGLRFHKLGGLLRMNRAWHRVRVLGGDAALLSWRWHEVGDWLA